MPNNIIMLDEELRRRREEQLQESRDTFSANPELTDEEKKVLSELDGETHTVVREDYTNTPIVSYSAPLDNSIQHLTNADGEPSVKLINNGDIVQSKEDQKREARDRALRTFRDLAIAEDDISDDEIVRVNSMAIDMIKLHFKTGTITADMVSKYFRKLPLNKFDEILPESFIKLYTTETEIKANNSRAKERLISALVYLTTIGPEMDYLNEYIENEHRLMLVSERLLQCSVDLVAALKSPEKLSELADRAATIDPHEEFPWEKYITGDARKVHNTFAQNAAIYEEYVKAYTKIRAEYTDPKDLAVIDEQINESQTKADVYSSVCKLNLFLAAVNHTKDWLKGNKRYTYKDLEREAISAIDRIRRSKQDVPFPTYRDDLAKYPKEMYHNYMKEFPAMLANYNSALLKVQDALRKDGGSEEHLPSQIYIDGVLEETTFHYFSLLLLIVYGRIMKRLADRDQTKEDAIMLDSYFILYCSLGTDTYLMGDVWSIMKPFVEKAIQLWPRPSTRTRK